MIPHIHTLFEFISIPYENQHQTLNIKKIDRGQIKFREYSITLLQPKFKIPSKSKILQEASITTIPTKHTKLRGPRFRVSTSSLSLIKESIALRACEQKDPPGDNIQLI